MLTKQDGRRLAESRSYTRYSVLKHFLIKYRILREPSPTLFAAVHLAMNELFDMDEIYAHLVQQGTTSVCHPNVLTMFLDS
jgi:hypothetical protein